MDWKKYLIPPVAIYAVIFLFISALIGFKVIESGESTLWVWLVALIITIVGLKMATNYAQPKTMNDGLKYGLVWLVVLVILDLILTAPFAGWDYFADWKSYLPYALTLLIPALMTGKK